VIIDPLTASLKQDVSEIVEQLLYRAGYPIARSGVVLSIGQYQLLVADACSGMHSVYSITALGLLYLYLMRHPQWWRNALLAASLIPLAIVANIVRVIILVLVTYHFGDAAGQGFVHGFTGIFLFIVALGLMFALDAALGAIAKLFAPRTVAA
jgi:exosortase